MGIQLKTVFSAAIAIVASTALIPTAEAQIAPFEGPSVLQTLDEILFDRSDTYFENRSIGSQIDFILGPGGLDNAAFPELEIDDDAEALFLAYEELMTLQTLNTPTIRTPDLQSPYTTSILLLPLSQASNPTAGRGLNTDGRLPLR
ncbi:hypothetical protein IQ241_19735 [Romeria aff. gracilis LEGE 07310]|uniref:Uncharacterized protein n=1 Tax=Vasconcelosia minhoensis LEGE 07310 TaxID=915328 RepID=A0A8J7ARX5_9CYAN|nr:hypothetical protein [Romeria gracilis]MBE9079501.1 hypothetical protein [Romeria aff. gracilis LEGE 07310]